MTRITEQLARLRGRIKAATDVVGRNPESVRILAVSKKQPLEAIRAARAEGLRHFGENYLQEATTKITAMADDEDVVWHFIGAVQSNKTRPIAEHFTWVHTVCNQKIAARLSAQRPEYAGDLQVLLQISPVGGANRGGIPAEQLPELVESIAELPLLRLRGLMIMPVAGLTEDQLRHEFARTRKLLDELKQNGHDVDTLSMGMSSDLEAAIMEGSTIVRIGSDIFGPRVG